MRASENLSKTSSTLNVRRSEARGFVADIAIHILLEVSLVGIVDNFLKNTVLSMIVGIGIVEGCQFLWKRWRADR